MKYYIGYAISLQYQKHEVDSAMFGELIYSKLTSGNKKILKDYFDDTSDSGNLDPGSWLLDNHDSYVGKAFIGISTNFSGKSATYEFIYNKVINREWPLYCSDIFKSKAEAKAEFYSQLKEIVVDTNKFFIIATFGG